MMTTHVDGAENGAFRYAPDSHHNRFLAGTISESEIRFGLGTSPKTFVAPAGTLIVG